MAAAFAAALISGFLAFDQASAAELEQDGIKASVATDKGEYALGDTAAVSAVVENVSGETISNIEATLRLPDELKVPEDASLSVKADALAPGEVRTIEVGAEVVKATGLLPVTGDALVVALLGIAILVGAGAFVIVHVRRGRVEASDVSFGQKLADRASQSWCIVLAVALATGSLPIVAPSGEAHAAEPGQRVSLEAKQDVTLDSQNRAISLEVSFDAAGASSVPENPDAGNPGDGSEVGNTHRVAFYIPLEYRDLLENADVFGEKQVADGDLLERPEDPRSKLLSFEGWFADVECTKPFDFNVPITQDTVVVAKFEFYSDEVDSDGDGLGDRMEDYLGTDPNNPDTDGDGLPDGIEVKKTSTSPLKVDTDENGVSDYDEDWDGDGLTNGEEVDKYHTDPGNADTDRDDLSDGREIELGTDPNNPDTDGDGVDDGWEVYLGTDPLVPDSSFAAEASAGGEATGDTRVTASVSVDLSAEQVPTLEVQKVGSADNPYVSPSIPGYLGAAYDFKVEGAFDSAVISFSYNQEMFGTPDEDFQPRIYYVNEETGELEKLQNQIVEGNVVRATVSHFSTYILINEIPFDKVWDADIAPPLEEGENGDALDVAFVIDGSGSMSSNDPYELRKDVTRQFIDKLREGVDKAAIVSFTYSATVHSDLTADKEALMTALEDAVYANGGTDCAQGVKTGLDVLEGSSSRNKFMVFLTDGEGGGWYADEIARANEAGIKVYAIGLGTANEGDLRDLAESTGGKYYEAKAGIDLEEVYDQIESETIDLTKDTNNDGIPDYYNDRIKNGTMVLSNGSRQFCGIDFNHDINGNLSDDYDGDGLKNGEELEIVETEAGGVYLRMKSDPTLAPSSHEEEPEVTSPKVTFNAAEVDKLIDDSNYYYEKEVDKISDDWFSQADGFLSALFGVNQSEVYRDQVVDAIGNHQLGLTQVQEDEERNTMMELLLQATAVMNEGVQSGSLASDTAKNTLQAINDIRQKMMDPLISVEVIRKEVLSVIEKVDAVSSSAIRYSVSVKAVSSTTVKITQSIRPELQYSKGTKAVLKGFEKSAKAFEVLETIQSINAVSANNAILSRNVDLLYDMKANSAHGPARDAAKTVMDLMAGTYYDYIYEKAESMIVDRLALVVANLHPVAKVLVVAKSAFDLLFGIGERYEQKFQMICLEQIGQSVKRNLSGSYTKKGGLCVVSLEDLAGFRSRLADIAHMRVLGENGCYEYVKLDGVAGWIVDLVGGNKEEQEKLAAQKAWVRSTASGLGMSLTCQACAEGGI
ncbi:hypothetical protein B5F40_06625 [Gordonibacter sp. An230]|nr:hypothetical protein B5F40_06625 [Gordonibacter sp. An230]